MHEVALCRATKEVCEISLGINGVETSWLLCFCARARRARRARGPPQSAEALHQRGESHGTWTSLIRPETHVPSPDITLRARKSK